MPLRLRSILPLWLPLAATWIMMALEGPYLSAVVARLGAPIINLAAFGLAFNLAWLAESPVIMLLSASTALAKDWPSYRALRRFVVALNAGVTLLLILIILPPVFRALAERVLGLPPEVARLAHRATIMLLPWPAAIGTRRFLQGLLVRTRQTRRVAYGTVLRLVAMSLTAAALAVGSHLPGACIGALSLSAGVVAEAAASRWMARQVLRAMRGGAGQNAAPDRTEGGPRAREARAPSPLRLPHALPGQSLDRAPTQAGLARFYFPLALTSMLAMCTGPLLILFMGRGADPVACIAAWPVVQSFSFFFRSGGVAFQEVGVALRSPEGLRPAEGVGRAALMLAMAVTFILALILATPLARLWFSGVVGLAPELLPLVLLPSVVLLGYPALDYALSYQRASLILAGRTRVITGASALEIGCLVLVMASLTLGLGWQGTLAAALALILGRLAACGFLALRNA